MYKPLTCFIMIAIFVTLSITGCAKKVVPVENIRVLAAIRTAMSIQSEKQVDNCRSLVKSEVEEGKISPELAKELDAVFELADQKQWNDAEKRIIKIQERYKPDSSTVHDHSHDHKH